MVVRLLTNIIASGYPGAAEIIVGFFSITTLGVLVRLNLAVERFMIPAVMFGTLTLSLALITKAEIGGNLLFGVVSFLFGVVFFWRLKTSEEGRNWTSTLITGIFVYLMWILFLLW